MFHYHCLNPISQVGLDGFSSLYVQTDNINDADAILVRSAAMHDLELPENLEAVARAGAGVNNIPLQKYAEQGIVVFNTPGANANGVKEAVLAGLLLASRDIVGGINWVQSERQNDLIAKDAEKEKKRFAGNEIMGKRLGIIGLGAIGVLVANAAARLGMEVYGYDPYISVDAAWNLSRDIRHIKEVDEIYRECDYITIHVPLMDSTRKMINKDAIDKMKDGVVLLNYARDLLVDEEAVVDALRAGKVKRYVSDFPNPTTAGAKGCIVTPHIGASTAESEDNCAKMAVKELIDYLEHGNIHHSVNYPECDMGICSTVCRIAINHRNIKNMIGQFASVLGEADLNIANMANQSKGEYAYSLFDLDTMVTPQVIETLKKIDGVLKVRVLK
ncbi:4-phosphoerythronate dehydrogenase [Marvinbryantia formatexigens DSM 14469]|uniref:D-3-phosphoglycerate dehydrogenase n=1 Tax=Marvinbryantia formatexigens DSM 14469 TaxID=478749 RepID=C6LEN2_9FIRM|nr:phosphoglycerate dehydrogenase [Marvinbryantia formatexigens]EET61015.1 4-phosphoerythronate dehydrogenase [Marvinbryantia formatexigens DSM 14469]UWO24701.1 phosphoglycerate dehydrogenase [Marvinbryantia formatexigens DSM 14469]SDF19597.1 D-3-phosphoglycerate dehydrogenase [Marvinbryantia formatexigens]